LQDGVFGYPISLKFDEAQRLTPAMAKRMNEDLVFDHAPAVRDFGFAPTPFRVQIDDLLPS
jgi:hypothetical protein